MDILLRITKLRLLFLILYGILLSAYPSTSLAEKPSLLTAIPPAPIGKTGSPTQSSSATLKYKPFEALLQKVVAIGPVYVTGDSSVPTAALRTAGVILATMLRHRPDISDILRKHGTFTAVASRSEHVCSLLYFARLGTALCNTYGEGGAGGTFSLPITACDEKNLLAEHDDSYDRYDRRQGSHSQNICVHELAHTIMNVGLSQTDRNRIDSRFLAARQEGLWKGDYAMTNDMEFWAEMTQDYFWASVESPYSAINHVANGPNALKRYDPATFALVDSIYQGSANLR